jgi:hypothetical protein
LTDAELRAYLLGQSTVADAERVEIRVLDDEDVFAALRAIEDDLFDDYVRGDMTADDRQRFASRYGGEHERLRLARALLARSASAPAVAAAGAHARPARIRPDARRWMLAAAAVVVAGVGITLQMRARRSPDHAPVSSAAPSAPSAPVPPVVLALTLATSRAGTTPPETVVPSTAAGLELRVRIDPADTFDSYSMELLSSRGIVVWRADALHASAAAGDLMLVADVPAVALNDGEFELAVRGSTSGRGPETLGFAALRITR